MRGHVLIDNFTLQGTHQFLNENDRGKVASLCLASLIDAVVLYDKIFIPAVGGEAHYGMYGNGLFGEYEDDTLWKGTVDLFADALPIEFVDSHIPRLDSRPWEFLNPSCQINLAKARQIYGSRNFGWYGGDLYPEMPFPSYDPDQVSMLMKASDGFCPFEEYRDDLPELLRIDPLLSRDCRWWRDSSAEEVSDQQLFSTFVGVHLYYTEYCIELARLHKLNYLPNPTRERLIGESSYFQTYAVVENVRRDIVRRFEQVRKDHLDRVMRTLTLRTVSLDAPMLFNYVRRRSERCSDIVAVVKEIRNSKEARAFRKFCGKVEAAIEAGDLKALSKATEEVNRVASKWEGDLETRWTSRRISLKVLGTDISGIEVPDLVLYARDLARHFVFLHKLVATL